MPVYLINLNKLTLKLILDLFRCFLQGPKIILLQDWILSDASVNNRNFGSKEESSLWDDNSVLEFCFLWPVWTLGFWSAVKTIEENKTLKQDDSQLNLLRFWERSKAEQLLFYSTDCFKILHWALVSPAIPRLEVFLICWKYVLQDVGGSGKENCLSKLKGFHIQSIRLLSRMRKGSGIKAFEEDVPSLRGTFSW